MRFKVQISILLIGMLFAQAVSAQDSSREESVRKEILANGEIIREALANSDIQKIKSLYHPDVIKALGYNDIKTGRKEVIDGISETLKKDALEFVENQVGSILVRDDIAIEQTRFSIKGIPKNGGESFNFRGRTMITYVKFGESPTGWATIQEIIQPYSE